MAFEERISKQAVNSVYSVHMDIIFLRGFVADELSFFIILMLQILDEWFGRTVICSCTKLSYDHAQSLIENPEKVFTVAELPPVSPQHSVHEIHQAVLSLHHIAKQLRRQRFEDGALRLDQVSLTCLAVKIQWDKPVS